MTDEPVNNDDEIDVIVDDNAAEGTTEVETSKEPQDWKAQFESAKKRAEEAEAKAAEVERKRSDEAERYAREVAESRKSTVSAEMTTITTALANLDHAIVAAKAKLSTAMGAADYDAVAEAQAEISEIAVKRQRITEGKTMLERRAEISTDPVEQYIQNGNMSAKAAAWIRSHPETVKTQEARDKLAQSHYLALGNGKVEGSDDYFDYIGKHYFGLKPKQDDLIVETKNEPRTSETRTPPAAPPSRGGATEAPNPTNRTTVRLTAAEREVAQMCGMTDAEYAMNKLALEKETRH
jgi:multidrug efflux pump subunit AcrA (membrane-fusion protein)